ncbi:Gamma-glutamylputrescine synthetase PuuA [Enhygromyxa salina]|uniref:Gamma-glutamylputrescine synthetase PuuA n=1 Tax=Enhygromyxa salina TaxID=215803 RepID=A0A2S9YGC4_9BACT|nr:glutamine synthetase family protein [Enhygromyxa salina]PRQ04157.1 Gamma-glutamylputrescine synthetase PuuA [Enhygromyxa salina]
MHFQDVDQLISYLDDESIRFHKVGVFDIDGVFRGKYMNREKFESALRKGFGFCDVVLGWDSQDQLFDNTTVSGWHTGYRDAPVSLDLSSVRKVPLEDDTILVIGQFGDIYEAVCPRRLLGRCVAKATKLGFFVRAALEYEFFMFKETPESARAKGYRDLEPLTPGMFGYSMLRSGVHAELYHDLMETMTELECPIEGLHTETGPGVLEAALCHDEIRAAADAGALFKTFTKILAQRLGLMATFMSKWSDDYPGQSGHIHVSLEDGETGKNLFFDGEDSEGMSQIMRWFIGGQVTLMPEVLAMICSTVNAYRRLVPGMWAPTHANWGVENRTTALRAIPGGATGTRSEYRIGPADANPYLALSAALATGLWGIENRIEAPPAVVGNAYDHPGEDAEPLPSTLGEATRKFAASEVTRELFGDAFVEHFAATRTWEDRQARKHVTDWDLARYFEII